MSKIDPSYYTKAKTQYKKLHKVFCPALDEFVNFNSEGFYHIVRKSNKKPRKQKDVEGEFRSYHSSYLLLKTLKT